jgi:hypothetical protein
MDESPKPPPTSASRSAAATDRDARLATAMRANLRRRKDQQRRREAKPDAAPEPVEEA